MAGLLALSFLVLLSGSALLSLVIGLLVMTLVAGKKGLLLKYSLTVLVMGVLYPVVMPQRNMAAIRDFGTVYEVGSISRSYYHRIQTLAIFNRDVLVRRDFGGKFFQLSGDSYFKNIVSEPWQGNLYKDLDGKKNIKSRYLEMQASLNLLAENTSLGMGLGNFQNNIGKYYSGFPKVNTAQPNEDNCYLIIASTSGILGLAAFLWIFLASLQKCRVSYRLSNGNEKALYWGVLGSLVTILTENLFSYLLLSSLLVPVIFLIYLSFKSNRNVGPQA
jgi:O-antigen ligase